MIEIKATRDIELKSFIAIAKVWVEDKRPDIVWLLQNYNNNDYFSEGEQNTLKQYLSKYLKLVKGDYLTDFSEQLIEMGKTKILVPESGIYEFIIFEDPFTRRSYPVHFIRHTRFSKKDLLQEGKNLTNYSLYENTFSSWHPKYSRCKIEFIKGKNVEFPQILDRGVYKGQVSFHLKQDYSSLRISVYDEKLTFTQEKVNYLDLDSVCLLLIKNYDEIYHAQKVTFYEVIKLKSQYDFIRHIEIKSTLPFRNIDEPSLYSIKISNLRLIPSDFNNAVQWGEFLLRGKLRETDAYVSSKKVMELWRKILEDSPILEVFPNYFEEISIDELLLRLYEDEVELYWKIVIADDLSIEVA